MTSNTWLSAFAFPVFFTAFEFLVMKFSADGTASSIAYSQCDFLPVIQVAAVTGISGITFMLTFIPSAIAVAWYYRSQKQKFIAITAIGLLLLIAVFTFGVIRINESSGNNSLTVGLIVLDEKYHEISSHPDPQKAIEATKLYVQQISGLAAKGAQLIVMPERALNITPHTDSTIVSILTNTAKQDHVYIITGYTNFKSDTNRNSAFVITNEGNIVADYNKVHLVTGLENQFKPGREPGLFQYNGVRSGTAICKDLDFPDYINKYGKDDVNFLCVPAWDFVVDDWLHSRMAVLRGVENGFSEVRAARQGMLTISDYTGKVMYEANCAKGNLAVLFGKVPVVKKNTIYTKFGDWFGVLNLIAALCFTALMLIRRKKL
jgi:apolipoprotein N-acyltransferase